MERQVLSSVCCFLLFTILCLINVAMATHFRGAHMWWKPLGTNSNNLKVQISFRIGWRGNYSKSTFCDSSTVKTKLLRGPDDTNSLKCVEGCKCVDGCESSGVGLMKYQCTDFSVRENWVSGKNSLNYTFPGYGSYNLSWSGKGWLGTLKSGADKPWEFRMGINLRQRDNGRINQSPVSASQPVIRLQYGCNQTINVPTSDDDNDVVRCRWAEAKWKECGGICGHVEGSKIDPITCQITFPDKAKIGWYAVAIQIEDFESSSSTDPLSSVPLQFLVNIYNSSSTCDTKPQFITPPYTKDDCILVHANQDYFIKITARTRDDKIWITEINTVSQKGMIKSPVTKDPVQPRDYYVNITWTGQLNQGSVPFCYSATDSTGVSSNQKCFTLAVGGKRPVPQAATVSQDNTKLVVSFDQKIQPARSTKPRKVKILSSAGLVLREHVIPGESVTFEGRNMIIKLDSQSQQPSSYTLDLEMGAARSTNYCGVDSSPSAKRLQYEILPAPTTTVTTTTESVQTTVAPCDTSYLKTFKVRYHGYPYCLQVSVEGESSKVRSPGGQRGLKLDGSGHVNVSSSDFAKTCFGNLKLCPRGFTAVFWVKVPDDKNRPIMCAGGTNDALIINIRQTESKGMHVLLQAGNKVWTIHDGKPDMHIDGWNHVAVSWIEDNGALLYVNGKRVGCGAVPIYQLATGPAQEYRIGGECNGTGTFSKLAMDDLQFWDKSLPWTDILHLYKKGAPYVFTRDPILPADRPFPQGGGHEYQGSPPDVCGYRGKGLQLDGKDQFTTLGTHAKNCLGNPTFCENGITLSFWMKYPSKDGFQCMISNGGQEDGRVGLSVCYSKTTGFFVQVRTHSHNWLLRNANKLASFMTWTNVIITWRSDTGLNLYQNGKHLSTADSTRNKDGVPAQKAHAFTIGKNSEQPNNHFGGIIDQVNFWETFMNSSAVERYYVSNKCVRVSMDRTSGALSLQGDVPVNVVGGSGEITSGVCNQAIKLKKSQHMSIKTEPDSCLGDLMKCSDGYTMSVWIKFFNLKCSRYIVSTDGEDSSNYRLSLSYMTGKGLVANVKTKSRSWAVNMKQKLMANTWYHVILAWTSDDGCKLYLNGTLVGRVKQGIPRAEQSAITGNVYIGRSFQDKSNTSNCDGSISIDELEMCDKEKFPEDFGHRYEGITIPTHAPPPKEVSTTSQGDNTWVIFLVIHVVIVVAFVSVLAAYLIRRHLHKGEHKSVD